MNYIEFVKGDTYTATFTITQNGSALDSTLVSKIYFTCNALELQLELTYSSSKWYLTIPASTSANLLCGTYDYDLTIKFVANTIKTITYEDDLVVLDKHNEVDYE